MQKEYSKVLNLSTELLDIIGDYINLRNQIHLPGDFNDSPNLIKLGEKATPLIINFINEMNVEIGKIADYHDMWNIEKMGNFQSYTPNMNPFSLTKEQRNSMIMYFKIYSVQFQAGMAQTNELIESNEALVKLLDKELEK